MLDGYHLFLIVIKKTNTGLLSGGYVRENDVHKYSTTVCT
jgi:hypothetical protein